MRNITKFSHTKVSYKSLPKWLLNWKPLDTQKFNYFFNHFSSWIQDSLFSIFPEIFGYFKLCDLGILLFGLSDGTLRLMTRKQIHFCHLSPQIPNHSKYLWIHRRISQFARRFFAYSNCNVLLVFPGKMASVSKIYRLLLSVCAKIAMSKHSQPLFMKVSFGRFFLWIFFADDFSLMWKYYVAIFFFAISVELSWMENQAKKGKSLMACLAKINLLLIPFWFCQSFLISWMLTNNFISEIFQNFNGGQWIYLFMGLRAIFIVFHFLMYIFVFSGKQ